MQSNINGSEKPCNRDVSSRWSISPVSIWPFMKCLFKKHVIHWRTLYWNIFSRIGNTIFIPCSTCLNTTFSELVVRVKACVFSQLRLVAHADPSAWSLLPLACRNSIILLAHLKGHILHESPLITPFSHLYSPPLHLVVVGLFSAQFLVTCSAPAPVGSDGGSILCYSSVFSL